MLTLEHIYSRVASMDSDPDGNLSSWCNNNCGCLKEDYEPVCGSDDRTYYSPCYAGCSVLQRYGDNSEKVKIC